MDRGFKVISADLFLEAARTSRDTTHKVNPSTVVLNADAEFILLADDSVDAIVCSLFFHHFKTLDKLAAELKRVLRPGGVVIATDVNAHNPFAWLFFNVIHRLYLLSWLTPNQRALWSSEIKHTFTTYGFGEFQFDSYTTELRRDWLGKSLGYSLNFYARAFLMKLTNILLSPLARGNVLISAFRYQPRTVR